MPIKKLDLYIGKKFVQTFFFVCLIFTLIAMSIDYINKVDKFIEHDLSATVIFSEYYINFVFWINMLLWPMFLLIAIIFFTSRMAYQSEIISILNAGVPFRRFLSSYLVVAGVFTALHLFANHYALPLSNQTRLNFENNYIYEQNDKGKTRDIQMYTSPDEKIYIRNYNKRDSTGRTFRLTRYEDLQLTYLLQAKKVSFLEDPNRWKIHDYVIHTFNGNNEAIEFGRGRSMDTIINMHPSDFVRYINQKEMVTTPDMNNFIEREKNRGLGGSKAYLVERTRRTAESVSMLLLCILGVSIASRKVRGGTGLHLALGISIGAAMILMSKFSVTFANSENVPSTLGVWIPNIIFSIIAYLTVRKAQK
ncbi:MAG: LptF/LptG family permease [Saprospiraceae bacterium]|nr:LptF/LptG family permease [Saprospiraceae bacterium]